MQSEEKSAPEAVDSIKYLDELTGASDEEEEEAEQPEETVSEANASDTASENQETAGPVREDEGLAEAADADRVEPAEAVAGGAHGVEDGGAERDGVDFLRVVGAPNGIVAVFAAEAFAIGREDRDLAPRGADVETCDELHASISVQS